MTVLVELPRATTKLARSIERSEVDPGWLRRVAAEIARVRAALLEHIAVTEGPSGRYAQLLRDAPRLAPGIDSLLAEHTELMRAVDEIGRDSDPAALRQAVIDLVARLGRHRQHGADLIYEAYAIDVGGET